MLLLPQAAQAAALHGSELRLPWALPFFGLLLTIATGPLLFPRFWHGHFGKVVLAWAALTLVPLALLQGPEVAFGGFVHAMLAEYLSFIILLFALYVVAGGILVTGHLRGTPLSNLVLLGLGTLFASVVGTTGAAMILIRPLLRANAGRATNVHIVVFFIFLVANVGGSLSPLGDPPLFVGFLRGIDFFWVTKALWPPTLFAAGLLLTIFLAIDIYAYRHDRGAAPVAAAPARLDLRVQGWLNLALIGAIVAAILLSAQWKPGVSFNVYGTKLELQNLARDAALLLIALASIVMTPKERRAANGFTFSPIVEVAILFFGIFICIAPVLAMLGAGYDGAFAPLLRWVSGDGPLPRELAYFWLSGSLSAFLDNVPTYIVFFGLAGGDPVQLMTTLAPVLTALSMGSVYMGAFTYIGNAPNFMVYAIAIERGYRMPGFFGYMLWSAAVLLPVFALTSWLFVGR